MEISVKAYAKINLFLDIDSIRDDGYHNILSLMQSVSLFDGITVEVEEAAAKEITVQCNDARIPCDSSNLVYKAAKIYPITAKIKITIDKNIPMSAGLAGGSADCAAVLSALNTLSKTPLQFDELKTLGCKIGADVPFCLEGGTCIAQGTGDVLSKTESMPDCYIVIAKMGEGMSTPEAYKSLDKRYNNFVGYAPNSQRLKLLVEYDGNGLAEYAQGLFNIFEEVVEPIRPCVTRLKSAMISNGAVASMMSGSGTSVFAIFGDEIKAKSALDALLEMGAEAHLCHPIKK